MSTRAPQTYGPFFPCAFALALSALSLINECAMAQSPFPTEQSDPRTVRRNVGEGDVDLIDPWRGDLLVKHADIYLPGNGGMDISIVRRYSAHSASSGLASSHSNSSNWAALGPGWRLLIAPRISGAIYYQWISGQAKYGNDPLSLFCGGTVTNNTLNLELPDGSTWPLIGQSSSLAVTENNWRIACSSGQVLATAPSGTVYDFGSIGSNRRIEKYSLNSYQIIPGGQIMMPHQVISQIDAVKATDLNGNWLKYTYIDFGTPITPWAMPGYSMGPGVNQNTAAANEKPARLLSQVTSSDGRSLQLSYSGTNGRLQTIQQVGSSRVWNYSYLTADANNDAVLSRVTRPDGSSWSYEYQPGAYYDSIGATPSVISPLTADRVRSRKLTLMRYPMGGTVSYEYDYYWLTQRIGGLTAYAGAERISRRTLSSGESWSYAYTRGGTGQYDTTTITGPEGVSMLRFMGYGYAIDTNTGAACTSGRYANNKWRIGRLMERIYPGGSKESYTYSSRQISSQNNFSLELGTVCDERTWVADVAQIVVSRDGMDYTTKRSDFDAYGNPRLVEEIGPFSVVVGATLTMAQAVRSRTLTYMNDSAKWVIGKVLTDAFPGASESWNYDTRANLVAWTKDNTTVAYTYTSEGDIATKVLPRNIVTTYSNYKRGIPQNEIQPEGVIVSRIVDDAGNVTSETNGEGMTTYYTYDGLNRVLLETYPAGNQKVVSYSATSKTATKGSLVETTLYDGFGRAASITLGGIATTYRYDGVGRKTFQSDPGATAGTAYTYDDLGRVVAVVNADSTYRTFAFAQGGKSVTDERGQTTNLYYRSYGNPDDQILIAISPPDPSARIIMTRNARDLISTISQGSVMRAYGYDSRYYLTSVTNPETGLTTYGRDDAGNMTSRSIGGSVLTYFGYDNRNRRTSATFPGGYAPSITTTYDRVDRVLTSSAATGSRSYTYDVNGNLVSDFLVVGGYSFNARYSYNANNQLSGVTYPVSNRTVSYAPDVLGRPTQVSGYLNSISYYPSGAIQQLIYANGTVSAYGQNSRLWPSSFSTFKTGTTTYINTSYGYDGVGNITTISDSIDSGLSRSLGYDGLNRLTIANGPWGVGSISYSALGNVASQVFGGSALYYTYDNANRLSSVSGARNGSYVYDIYGNVSAAPSATYSFDDASNLRCVNCVDVSRKIAYDYDGMNSRSTVLNGGTLSYEMYDSKGQKLIEYTPALNKLTEYIYLGGKRVAQRVTP